MKEKQLVEIWGDIVDTKELLVSIGLHILFGSVGIILAPKTWNNSVLLCGLTGVVLATIICSIRFKPKRIIQIGDEENPEETINGFE